MHVSIPPRVLQRHVLPITQYLLQDTEPQVRSSVCKQLPSLLCKVDQLSENLLLTSLLDAAQDSSANVRCAVLDVLIESEPYIYKGYIKDLILPTLKKLVESCFLPGQDEFLLHVCKLYSRLCNTYKEYMQLEEQAWFVSQFASLCQVDNEPMTSFLCSNLVPMMLFVESAPGLCQVLVSCVLALSTSPYVSVRQILSSTLFEIVKTCDVKSRRLLLEVLMVLLREKLEVFHSLIPHLYSLISSVLNSSDTTENYPSIDEKLIASLRCCEETVSKCYKWRLHVLLMQEIQKLVNFLSATTFMEHFQDILFLRIKKSRPIPSRLAASKTLLVLLTKLDNESLTSKCISRIHKDLYCSRSFYDRNLFVKICHQTIQMLSFEEFKKYFLPSLILLSGKYIDTRLNNKHRREGKSESRILNILK
uniref:Serine/threonine-protein phosphatase 4 regulatory subunit 4 n=1 Tax=Cacopsylla melanoneura TaxID=428564 RepID=A0A8D8LN29_9HEMI